MFLVLPLFWTILKLSKAPLASNLGPQGPVFGSLGSAHWVLLVQPGAQVISLVPVFSFDRIYPLLGLPRTWLLWTHTVHTWTGLGL